MPKGFQDALLAGSRCEHAWRTQRPANDWAGFVENFREVLACGREEAKLLSELTGLRRYDAMVEQIPRESMRLHLCLRRRCGGLAEQGDAAAVDLPRPLLHSGDLDFSFAGLKTAVLTRARKLQALKAARAFA